MNWKGSEKCVLCGHPEDANHLLFECSLARFVWSFMGETLGWQGYPRNIDDLVLNWLLGGFKVSYQVGLDMLRGGCMGNLARNKMCMSQIFLNNPIDIIHLCLSFVQKWRVLARSVGRSLMGELLEAGLKKVKEFKPSGIKLSDVEFI
jgi:hypothetical protein